MADFSDLVSQAKKMQEKMKETQEALKKIEVEGVSGGNAVKVIMNGDGELKKITFDDVLFKESKEIFEDLIVAAHNDAKSKLKKKTTEEIVLSVKDLQTHFSTKWGLVKAVDGVSFDLKKDETLAVVGESGSGKSVTALSIMQLIPSPPGFIVGGEINLEGENLLNKSDKDMQSVRGSRIAMVLQDPMTALNPVFKISDQVGETLNIHKKLKGRQLYNSIIDMLKKKKVLNHFLIFALVLDV